MFRNFKNVSNMVFGSGCFNMLDSILDKRREIDGSFAVFIADSVFSDKKLKDKIPLKQKDMLLWADTTDEPKTSTVDEFCAKVKDYSSMLPAAVIGIGGGSVMDLAKALSLMLTNPGSAADYQGWDLIKKPAVFHIGVPTLSGTGAEVSRTTVLTGPEKKLGINSDYTVFDQIILDPDLLEGVPKDQRFYTGMDCYIHCVESLEGTYINEFSKAHGKKAMELCRKVFLENGLDSELMIASYMGGMSIVWSQVGICHALSYGLAFVLKVHHGIGNCIAFNCLDDYYPEGVAEFRKMMEKNKISLPENLTSNITDKQLDKMADVALVLEPLWENALGKDWKKIMTRQKIQELYKKM